MIAKLNFQQPFLQSSVSHDPLEIILILIYWFGAQETFLITIINVVLLNIFVETQKNRIEDSKEQNQFEI